MRSHDIDYPSLTLGATFTGLGILLATGSLDVLRLDWPKVAGPVTIIVVGLLIGAVALIRRTPDDGSEMSPAPSVDPGTTAPQTEREMADRDAPTGAQATDHDTGAD
jgi:hypothetical protein